jgi:molybdopterin molybdotransferase
MISYAEAVEAARAAGARRAMGEEVVPLAGATGRVAARTLAASEAIPAFANSGMDGFAVRAAELASASVDRPVTLRVGGSVAAGDDPSAFAGVEGALEIMTGAALPAGFDAVVRVEEVEVRGREAGVPTATFRAPVPAGNDVRPPGEDFRPGDVVAATGTVLRAEHVMALAMLGLAEVPVRRRPRVAMVATGQEIVPYATRTLPPGAIRNSTTPYVAAALAAFGAELVSAEAIGDDVAALRRAIEGAASGRADLVLTSGALSAGKLDFVAPVLRELGARVAFHKVAVRPGKPALLAELPGGALFVGLPGNPVASAVSLRFLVVPLLRAALGLAPEAPLRARLAADTKKPEGLRCFFKAVLRAGTRGLEVEVLAGQASSIVSSLVRANAWAVLPEAGTRCAAGSEVDVFPLGARDGWPEVGA